MVWKLTTAAYFVLVYLFLVFNHARNNKYDRAIQQKNTSINSLDAFGFRDLGTLKDYKKLAETADLTPFRLIKNFSFLGEFHVNDLTTKFGRWVDTK